MRAISALAALLLSAGVGALQFKSNVTGAPDVAAVIPTYPKDFDKIAPFLKDWEKCSVGQQNLDIHLIFTSETEASEFITFYGRRGPWKALVTSVPDHPFLPSWKKLDGLAQLLASSNYEYVLVMDCELALKKCDGFEGLANNLRQKFLAKTWYGSSLDAFWRRNHDAACSVLDCSSEDALKAVSNDLNLFTWWNDIPWIETTSAKQMFEKWGERLEAKNTKARALGEGMSGAEKDATLLAQGDKVLESGDYVGILHAAFHGGILGEPTSQFAEVDPVAVSGELGRAKDPVLMVAGRAFEHMIYQYYMVVYNGFSFHDLKQDGLDFRKTCQPEQCIGSNMESFWRLYTDEEKQAKYINLIHPLWIRANRNGYTNVTDYIPLAFHADRI